tara:strand:- start:100 stop:273 length:174 start_codon:yes stop_codon:yes gene_type:complete
MNFLYNNQPVNILHYGFDICIIEYKTGKQELVRPSEIKDLKTNKFLTHRTRPTSRRY